MAREFAKGRVEALIDYSKNFDAFFDENNLPYIKGIDLGITFGEYYTGASTAKMYQDKIIVTFTGITGDQSITVATPIGFKVIDSYTVISAITEDGATIAVENHITEITDAMVSAEGGITRASTLALAQQEFDADDDDLVVLANGSGSVTGYVVISIIRT